MTLEEINNIFYNNVRAVHIEMLPNTTVHLDLLINGEPFNIYFSSMYKVSKFMENIKREQKFNEQMQPTNYSLKEVTQTYVDRWKKGEEFWPHKKRSSPYADVHLMDGCMNVIRMFNMYHRQAMDAVSREAKVYCCDKNEMIYKGKLYPPSGKVGLPNGHIEIWAADSDIYGYSGWYDFTETPTEFGKIYLEDEDRYVWFPYREHIIPPNYEVAVAYKFFKSLNGRFYYNGIYGSPLYRY